jgi:hypothetical protein
MSGLELAIVVAAVIAGLIVIVIGFEFVLSKK